MKNTMLSSGPATAGNCINLRPDKGNPDRCLVPVRPPALIAARGWRVIAASVAADGNMVELMADGNVLGASVHAPADAPGEPYIVADNLDGEIVTAIAEQGGFTVMTGSRRYSAVFDGNSSMLRIETIVDAVDFPAIATEVASESVMPLPVAGFGLKGSYTAQSVSLDAADAGKLAQSLCDAYSRGSADATASGMFLAPVFVRYRLLGVGGRLLFESVPKLHVPTGRHDGSMTAEMPVESLSAVGAGTVSIPVYRIDAILPASQGTVAEGRVARLELQVTPQLHRVDGTLSAIHRLSGGTLTATLPGCGGNAGSLARFRNSVLRALGACDSLFTTVLTVENPFPAGAAERRLAVSAVARTVAGEQKLLQGAAAAVRPLWLSRCRMPHRFTAAAALRDGNLTIYADPTVRLFEGHRVEHFANHGSAADVVETAAVVTFGDGSRVVSHGTARAWRSMSLSPVIAYPDSAAVSVELQLCDSDGVNRYVKLPLRPCGRYACYVSDDLAPVNLDSGKGICEFHLPQPTHAGADYPGHLVADDGVTLTGCTTGAGRIAALHHAARPSSSAWESSRARYLALGDDGIFAIIFGNNGLIRPVRLDSRPVSRPDAVAIATPAGDGSRVCVIAGGDLVAVTGSRAETLAADVGADMLAWDSRHCELLAVRAESDPSVASRALVMHTGSAGGWSERLLSPVSSCFSRPGCTRLTSAAQGGLFSLDRSVDSPVRCVYRAEVVQHPRHIVRSIPFIDEITVDLTAASVDGTVILSGHHGRGPERHFSVLVVSGELNRPVAFRTLMPPRLHCFVTVDAMLSADARLTDSFNTITRP